MQTDIQVARQNDKPCKPSYTDSPSTNEFLQPIKKQLTKPSQGRNIQLFCLRTIRCCMRETLNNSQQTNQLMVQNMRIITNL